MILRRALLALGYCAFFTACSGDGPTGGEKPAAPSQVAAVSGDAQTGTAGTKLSNPLVVRVTDASGKAVSGTTVTWAIIEGGGTLSSSSSTTDAQGQAQADWTLGAKTGQNKATATVGSLAPVTFSAAGTTGPASKVEKTSGDGQVATVGAVLTDSLAVKVTDAHGNAVGGATVTWQVTAGGGAISPATATTTAEGIARAQWTLGKVAGTSSATATVSGATPATFSATAKAGTASRLEKASGDSQTGAVGAALPNPLVVKATDENGNPVQGVSITWQVTAGGGSIAPGIRTTDSAGLARGTWTLGTTVGTNSASAAGVGATLSFGATATAGPVASVAVSPSSATIQVGNTAQLSATLTDAYGNVLEGQTVAWTSSNTSIATVSSSGVVTGVAAGGPVTITATSGNKSGTAQVSITSVPVASVSVSPSTASIQVDGTVELSAIVKDAAGNVLTGRPVTWSISDATKASISTTGVVKGLAVGSVTATATVEGKTGTSAITVTPGPVATVEVSPSTASISVGASQQFTATLRDASGNLITDRSISWTSSNTSVATVSSSGVVTGVAVGGPVMITATSEGKSGTASVSVTQASVASVTVSPSSATIQVGGTQQFTATLKDANGNTLTGRSVTWASSNTSVATVSSSGLVSGVAAGGPVTITATSEGKSGTAQVSVVRPETSVGGIISTNTTWTLANSPYKITSDVQVAYGATLTIEAGVVVNGESRAIEVWGNLNSIGTAGSRITFNNTHIVGRSSSGQFFALNIQNADVNGGSIYRATGYSQNGSIILRHSVLSGIGSMYLWYPSADSYIEYNIFTNSGGISTGLDQGRKVYIRHNSFYGQTGNLHGEGAVLNWASYGTSEVVLENNSFWSTDRVAVSLPKNYDSARLVAKNNYWGTTDEAVIQTMIFDKNDDLASAGYIEYNPFLTSSHPNTPTR